MDWLYQASVLAIGGSWVLSFMCSLMYIFDIRLPMARICFYAVSFIAVVTLMMNVFYDRMLILRTGIIISYLFVLAYAATRKVIKALQIFVVFIVEMATAEMINIILLATVFEYSISACFFINAAALVPITAAGIGIKRFAGIVMERENAKAESTVLVLLTIAAVFTAMSLQLNFELSLIGKLDLNSVGMSIFLSVVAVTYIAAAIATIGFILRKREEKKNRIITEQQRILEEMYDGTRMFRHNYRNTIIALQGYCESGDIETLGKRLRELREETDDLYGGDQLRNVLDISDAGLRNLIMLKIFEARRRGIDVSVSVSGKEFSHFEDIRVLNAVGALLDNATEASTESSKPYIEMELISSGSAERLLISNSFGKKPDVGQIMTKGYSTKDQSGLGLYYVNKIISKKDNMDIVVSCSDCMFRVRIEAN